MLGRSLGHATTGQTSVGRWQSGESSLQGPTLEFAASFADDEERMANSPGDEAQSETGATVPQSIGGLPGRRQGRLDAPLYPFWA